MTIRSRAVSLLLDAGVAVAAAFGVELLAGHGDGMAARAGMTHAEISALHVALFLVTVWIVSSLRIHRLLALWRVGPGQKTMRGASGGLQPRGPKARAAAGGSVGGAGASGNPGGRLRAGNRSGRWRKPAFANDNAEASPTLDNFRG